MVPSLSFARLRIASQVVIMLGSHKPNAIHPDYVRQLRGFAESEEERSMPLDELGCTIVVRERERLAALRTMARAACA